MTIRTMDRDLLLVSCMCYLVITSLNINIHLVTPFLLSCGKLSGELGPFGFRDRVIVFGEDTPLPPTTIADIKVCKEVG